MGIIAKKESGVNYQPVAEGVYTAVCYAIIDVGIQYNKTFQNSNQKIVVIWELPDELIEIEGEKKPRAISKEYTLSLSEKSNLLRDLQAWRGKSFTEEELAGFDLKNVLGTGCQIQVIHHENNGKVYQKISSIMALPKGMKAPKPVNPVVYYELTEKTEEAVKSISALPKWIQDKVLSSETYKAYISNNVDVSQTVNGDTTIDDSEDVLPF